MFYFQAFNLRSVVNSVAKREIARRRLLRVIDNALYEGYLKTQNVPWTPHEYGSLMRTIAVAQAKYKTFNVAIGGLYAGSTEVEYARIQEFEHKRKKLYLLRAIRIAERRINLLLRSVYTIIPGNVTLYDTGSEFAQYVPRITI